MIYQTYKNIYKVIPLLTRLSFKAFGAFVLQ